MQALKESHPPATKDLTTSLTDLLDSFKACKEDFESRDQPYPFERSERQVKDTISVLFPDLIPVTQPSGISEASTLNVSLPEKARLETFQLGPRSVPRVFTGLWQLSSSAWGTADAETQTAALTALVEDGYIAADMADHYVCHKKDSNHKISRPGKSQRATLTLDLCIAGRRGVGVWRVPQSTTSNSKGECLRCDKVVRLQAN